MATMMARRKKFHGEKFLKFRCTECSNCCTDTIVPITHIDVARMIKGTKLRADEIAEFYKSSEFSDGGEGLHFATLDIGKRVMGLKKRYDEADQREACKFFLGGRCSVYEHRPVTCRVWPFTLSFDSTGKKLSRIEINRALPCPYELDGKNESKDLIHDWNWDDQQDDEWSKMVKRWNEERKGGTADEFFDFMGLGGN